ncbi:MAG TPA: helix-turn-helix transcriptional regulator [Solirubrobacterales bacterium]|nr:helix-turn-helix transcriptional regulator [Solirubrobacterales bacterium]
MSNGEPRTNPDDREANELLGATVAALRQQAGLTRAELAQRAELREREVVALEAGELEPTWGDLRRIARGLDVPLEKLLQLVEEREDSGAR